MVDRILDIPLTKSFFLFGPRQTGKSTLLRKMFPPEKTIYYDLLKTEEYERLSIRPSLFREEMNSRPPTIRYVVLDEIQRVPSLLNEIHALLESQSPSPPLFALCGSSARKLKRAQANLLAGRASTYHLHPLTHRECDDRFSLEKALNIGTLPSVYLAEDERNARETLKAYVETYLKEEVTAEALTRNVPAFLRFLSIAGDENGNVINLSNIARETGTSYQTVKEYFQILEDTLMGALLLPYARSERKRLVKHPKFYLFDTGIERALSKQLTLPLERHTTGYGRCFEHFLLTEIMRLADYARCDYTFSFFRTESGAEVDLIVETPDERTYAIEVKASDAPDSSHLRGLRSFLEICPTAVPICASLSPRPREIGKIRILPWQDIFALLGI
ncbi:MAG: hypothetical protein A2Z34_04620 [Planctomycetes bacterium RBG_16_59_8]|nr:MAG: hypothetical protein A2Z34_04620 [Planctomycetes bacterium RBG_16_59_8]